ncbi:MAG: hypothetical protein IPK19_19355 [Chloroflexi bacterium]|nr:hypothetical protein [Chloroflexota bacterium]
MIQGSLGGRGMIGAVLAATGRRRAPLIDRLPATGLLALWYAGDGSGPGSALTTAGDGQPVSAWADAVASLSPAASGSQRPTYRQSVAAFNGRGAVEFAAAASQHLSVNAPGGLVANRSTYGIFVVFATTATAAGDLFGEFRSTSATPTVLARYNNTGLRGLHRSDANVSASIQSGGGFNDSAAHVLAFQRTAANAFELFCDGVSLGATATAPGTTTVDRIEFGRFGGASPSTYFTGQIALIAAYSVNNRAAVEPLLFSDYGIG